MACFRRWAPLLLVAPACDASALPTSAGECDFGKERQGVVACAPRSLDPVTDPESPDFGRVNCAMIELGTRGSEFCDCAWSGYRAASASQVSLARAELEQNGECGSSCCEDLCFCERLQLEGEELTACQGGDETRQHVETAGWCYVEPDVGVGDPSTVNFCASSQRQFLYFTPVGSTNYTDVLVCESTP